MDNSVLFKDINVTKIRLESIYLESKRILTVVSKTLT